MQNPVWFWLLPLLICSPWIVGIAWAWAHRPRDRALPMSMAERELQKLAQR